MLSGALLAALVAVLTVAATGTASAQTTDPGRYGCNNDTIASTKISGVTYTAKEETCIEVYMDGASKKVRGYGATRCYRSGAPFTCLVINGDSVHTHMWINGVQVGGTLPGDSDCKCQVNYHYSDFSYCIDQINKFQAREENLRVAWVAGVISGLHSHAGDQVWLAC
jgi:hypothetical protein